MAKFRDSVPDATVVESVRSNRLDNSLPPPLGASPDPQAMDRSIGDILSELRSLTAEQVQKVLALQESKGIRFGEAAVALGLASKDDVLFALSQQFHYPYAPEEKRHISPELVTLNEPFSAQAEAFRAMRSQVMMRVFGVPDATGKALAVVSPQSGDGKTFFAANLAVTLAQLGGRTILVDANLRAGRQHDVFKLRNESGLSGILSGRAESDVVRQVPAVPSLFVMPVGVTPPNPVELVERPAFGLLIRELQSKFDHVVVDSPAASVGADSAIIAARCGAAVVVARRNSSHIQKLQELTASFALGHVKVVGVVLNEH